MSNGNLNISFSALVERTIDVIEFVPITIPSDISTFLPFYLTQEPTSKSTNPISETYQRIKTPESEQNTSFNYLLATKESEVLELKSLLAERDVELDKMHGRLHAELAEIKKLSVTELAQYICDSMKILEQQIISKLAQDISEILAPFVTKQFLHRSLDEFKVAVNKCLTGNDLFKVRISGPATLIDCLKADFANQLADIDWTESESLNVSAEINSKIISTRLDAWSNILIEK